MDFLPFVVTPYGPADLTTDLAAIAGTVTLYIAGGIAAGLVVMALMLGVDRGVRTVKKVGK